MNVHEISFCFSFSLSLALPLPVSSRSIGLSHDYAYLSIYNKAFSMLLVPHPDIHFLYFFSSVSLHCNVFARVRAQITHTCLPGRTRLSSQFAFLVIFKWKSTYKTVCCRSVFALCCCDCVVHACSDCNYLALFCIIFFLSLFCCAFETRFDRINHDVFLDNFSWS